jgi:two-component system NtrC family sensor kinase
MKKIVTFCFILLLAGKNSFEQIRLEINSLHHQLKNAKDDTSRVLLLSDLSFWYLNVDTDSSIAFSQQALSLAEQKNYLRGKAKALANLGNSKRFLGDISEGMELCLKGLEIAKKNSFHFETALCLDVIASIYADLGDDLQASQYFEQSRQFYDLATLNKNEEVYGILFDTDAGISYQQTGQLDSSLFFRQKALKQALSQQSGFYSVTLMFMGDIQFHMGKPALAMQYLHQSLEVTQKYFDPRSSAETYIMMAEFFSLMNQPDSAIVYARKGLTDARLINHKWAILKASLMLAKLYEHTNVAEAYQYLELARNVNEEFYGAKKVQGLQKLMSQEQARLRKMEADQLAYNNKIRQYVLIGGFGMILLIAFILFRNNLAKRKANKILESTLSNLKSTQAQLIQSEKMASLGELTAGIAHEIQNPLNFVNNFSDLSSELIDEMKSELAAGNVQLATEVADDIKQNLEKINHHGKRADAIVKGMLQHSQISTGVKELTDINALADEYLRLAYHGLRAKDKSFNATLKTDCDQSIGTINIIPQDIGRVLLNLINNAFYAVAEKKKACQAEPVEAGDNYEPTVSLKTKKLDAKIEISVADNGNGIPQKVVYKIFQPFFTTKPTGEGTGLGLSLSYDIIKAHGGEIKVETKEGEGSEFIIKLPGV